MITVKVNEKELPFLTTGKTIKICKEELHSDLLRMYDLYHSVLVKGDVPQLDTIAKLLYCGIKTANPTIYKSYDEFMESLTKARCLLMPDNIVALHNEYTDFFSLDDGVDEEEKGETPKKKANQ